MASAPEDYDYDPILNPPVAAASDSSFDIHSMDLEQKFSADWGDVEEDVKEDDGYSLPSPCFGFDSRSLIHLQADRRPYRPYRDSDEPYPEYLKGKSNAGGVDDFSSEDGEDVNVSAAIMNEEVDISSSRCSTKLHPSPPGSSNLKQDGNRESGIDSPSVSNDGRVAYASVKKDIPISTSRSRAPKKTILKFPHLKQETPYYGGSDESTNNEDMADASSVRPPARGIFRYTSLSSPSAAAALAELDSSPDIHSMDLAVESNDGKEDDGYSLPSPRIPAVKCWSKPCNKSAAKSEKAPDEPYPGCLKGKSNAKGVNLQHDFSSDDGEEVNISPAMKSEKDDGCDVYMNEKMDISSSRFSDDSRGDAVSVSKDATSDLLSNEQIVDGKSPADEKSELKPPAELELDRPQDHNDSFNDSGNHFDSPLEEEVSEGSGRMTRKRLFEEESPRLARNDPTKKIRKTPEKSGVNDTMSVLEQRGQHCYSANLTACPENDGAEPESFGDLPRVTCRKKPFYVDVSSLKIFYEEIEIIPPLDSYHSEFLRNNKPSESKSWIVKMGDTVTLEVEPSKSAVARYPFCVAWGPVEIISIFREHATKEECVKLRDSISVQSDNDSCEVGAGNINDNDIKIEIRWLYRREEIPCKFRLTSPTTKTELEEVFESDHLQIFSADSILSPVLLHEHWVEEYEVEDVLNGLPCVNYNCSRFWSKHRKSFVPSGSMSQRVFRGRMHSGFFGRKGDRTAQLALKRLDEHEGSLLKGDQPEMSWQEAFQSAIKSLSLAEAAQDVQEGATLLCRGDERDAVADFLRTSICRRQGKAMFIGGPPGTGKTATVRSVIAELKEEQSKGDVPEFQFVELNGMELISPFDAYPMFWEALSGIKKESLAVGGSAACIDSYFCEDSEDYGDYEGEIARKPVTVLLLDEIDYLVTKQETVLYSFFDWPLRAVPSAKLIVVGIANTLNLPERLSPKLSSRISQKRIFFSSYNDEEIVTIIKERLGMVGDSHDPTRDVFEIDAIRFAARKTANRTGDIRKAFNLCKVAAESVCQARIDAIRRGVVTSEEHRPIVSTKDVVRASNDAPGRIMIKAMKCSTDYQACLLIALGSNLKGREDQGRVTYRDLRNKMVSLANSSGDERYAGVTLIHNYALDDMVTSLCTSGILNMSVDDEGYTPRPLVGLNVSLFDMITAFKDTPHSRLANKHLTEVLDF